jgi:hypothetical protein
MTLAETRWPSAVTTYGLELSDTARVAVTVDERDRVQPFSCFTDVPGRRWWPRSMIW